MFSFFADPSYPKLEKYITKKTNYKVKACTARRKRLKRKFDKKVDKYIRLETKLFEYLVHKNNPPVDAPAIDEEDAQSTYSKMREEVEQWLDEWKADGSLRACTAKYSQAHEGPWVPWF